MSLNSPSTLKTWLAVLSVSLGAFIVVTSEFLPIGLLTQIASGLNISAGTAGLLVTVPGLVAAVTAPLLTIFAGRLDRRFLVLALLGLLVVANILAALAPNLTVMLIARVVFGISLGGFWTVAVTLGARLMPENVARGTTFILAGVSIATVAGVPAGTFLAGFAGWRTAFGALAGTATLVAIVQLFVLPALPSTRRFGAGELARLLSHVDARLGLLTIAFAIAGHFAAYTYVTPFLLESGRISSSLVGTLLFVFGFAGIIGNFAGGALAGRNLRATLVGVIVLLAGSVLLMPLFGRHPAGATALLVVWGLAFGALPISLQLWVFKAAPGELEGGAALVVSTFQIFIALGSVAGGRIVDAFGSSTVMLAGGATALVALWVISLSKHKPARNAAPSASQPHFA
ncbi:MFS transporter [Oleiharenicola lentus]|uniref:MFS transporter n=1 Tax=Oleiharenicola lentus TaxID=2508720 RepID=UPI003F66D6B1